MTAPGFLKQAAVEHRAVGNVVAIVPFIALLCGLAFFWSRAWIDQRASVDANVYELGRLRPLINNAAAAKSEYEKALAAVSKESLLYQDLDDIRLLATFQSAVKTRLDATDLQIANIQSVQPHEDGGMRNVSVRLQVSGDYGSFLEFLSTLRSAKPRIFVDSLDLVSDQATSGMLVGRPAQSNIGANRVIAQIELHSLALEKSQ